LVVIVILIGLWWKDRKKQEPRASAEKSEAKEEPIVSVE